MDNEVTDGAGEVEKPAPAATGASATPPDATAESSPASEETAFHGEVERLQGKPASADSQPAEKEETESAEVAEENTEPLKDEPGADSEETTKGPNDLSKPVVDPDKGFSSRPEWKKAAEIADKLGPTAGKEMRHLMREILKTETTLKTQVEQFKPAHEAITRIERAAGKEGVEGSIRLIEGWQAGDPQARKILQELMDDFDRRTGNVITSPDLTDKLKRVDEQMAQGLLTEDEAKERRAELQELERTRATAKQLQSRTTQTQQLEQQQRQQAEQQQRVQEVVTVANNWQKEILAKDPDYPALAELHETLTETLANRKMQELGRELNGGEAKQVLEAAYKQVKAQAMKFQPKPKAKVPVTGGNGSSAKTKPTFASEDDEFYHTVQKLQGQA